MPAIVAYMDRCVVITHRWYGKTVPNLDVAWLFVLIKVKCGFAIIALLAIT
jgi:hypothetical protein